jgi:hypothetical protein
MQQLNLVYPDKEDFQLWLKEIKQDIIREIRSEVLPKEKPRVQYKTRSEIAKDLRISLVTLHNHTVNGLPSVKIGKRRLYDPVQVEKYFEAINSK